MLTPKQIANQAYYKANRQQILEKKKDYQAGHREEINARVKRRRATTVKRRCYICGGVIVEDIYSGLWQCLNPECEAEFREVG